MSHFAMLWKAHTIEHYRRSYEKEKLLSLEAGNVELPRRTLCQKLRHARYRCRKRIKRLFRSCCPEDSTLSHLLLYLRTDQTFPNFLLKSVLGFVGGILLTYIFFMFLVFQLSVSLAHATAMSSLVGVMLTLGLAFSYRVRCLVFLLLPQLFSEVGRYTLLGYALILILTGPAKNTLHNSEVLSESMVCGQEQLENSVRQIQESMSRPFHSMRDTIQLMVESVKEVAKKIKESLMAIKRMVLSIVRALQAPLSWLSSIALMCNKKVGSPSERCHRALDDGVLDCRARLGPYFSWLCSVTYVAKFACEAAKVMDFMCVLVDFVGDTVVATIKRKLRTFSNHVETMLFFSVHIHHSYSFSTNPSRNASQVAAGIVTEIRHRADRLLQWFSWMSCITSLFLLLIIFRAKYYQHMYESRVRYDNRYITREMRELDLRRAREGRDTVLPLNRRERADCVTELQDYRNITRELRELDLRRAREGLDITTTSLRLVASERLSLARSAVFLSVTTFKLLVHMAVDYSLFWVLVTIRYHGRFERPPLPAAPDGGVVVSGTGALAAMLRALAAALAAPLSARPAAAPASCLPDPSPPDTQRYSQIGFLVLLLWLFALLQPYGLRFRHLVMDHYRPERARARAVWLYNHILRKRGGFLKMARRKLHRDYKLDEQVKDHYTFKQWLDAVIPCWWLRSLLRTGGGDARCVLCGVSATPALPDSHLVQCETEGCAGVYCVSCYEDLGRLCTACLTPADYGDLSDISLEKGSSAESSLEATTTEAESEFEEEYVDTPEWRSASNETDDDTSPSTKGIILKLRENMKSGHRLGERKQSKNEPNNEARSESLKKKTWKRFFKKTHITRNDVKNNKLNSNNSKNSLWRSTHDLENVFCFTTNNTSSNNSICSENCCSCKPKKKNILRKIFTKKDNSADKPSEGSEDSICLIGNERKAFYTKYKKQNLNEMDTKIENYTRDKIHNLYLKKKIYDSCDECEDNGNEKNYDHNNIKDNLYKRKPNKSSHKEGKNIGIGLKTKSEAIKVNNKNDILSESDDTCDCGTESEDDLCNLGECECDEETESQNSEKDYGVQTFEKWQDIEKIKRPVNKIYNDKRIIKLKDQKVQTNVNMNDLKAKKIGFKPNVSEEENSENKYQKTSVDNTSHITGLRKISKKRISDRKIPTKRFVKGVETDDDEEVDDCLCYSKNKNLLCQRHTFMNKSKNSDSETRHNKSKSNKRLISLRRKTRKTTTSCSPGCYSIPYADSKKHCTKTKLQSSSSSISSSLDVDKSNDVASYPGPSHQFGRMQNYDDRKTSDLCQCNYWDILSNLKSAMCSGIEGLFNHRLFWRCDNLHTENLRGQCQSFSRNYDCQVINKCPSDMSTFYKSSANSDASESLHLSQINCTNIEKKEKLEIESPFEKYKTKKLLRPRYRSFRTLKYKNSQSIRIVRRRKCLSTRKFRRKSCRSVSKLTYRDRRNRLTDSKFTTINQIVYTSMPSILKNKRQFKMASPEFASKVRKNSPTASETQNVKTKFLSKKNLYSEIYANEMGFDPVDEAESIKNLMLAYDTLDRQATIHAKQLKTKERYPKPSESPLGPWAAEYKWPPHLEKPPCRCPLERCTCGRRQPHSAEAIDDPSDEEPLLQKRRMEPGKLVKSKWSLLGLYQALVRLLTSRGFLRGKGQPRVLAGQGDLLPLLDRALYLEKIRYRDKGKIRRDCLARCHKFYRETKTDTNALDYSYQDSFDKSHHLENERRFDTLLQKREFSKKIMSRRGGDRARIRNDEASLQDLMDDLLSDGRTLGSTQSVVSPEDNYDTVVIDIEPVSDCSSEEEPTRNFAGKKKHGVKFSDVKSKYYVENERPVEDDVRMELVRPSQSAGHREFKWTKFATMDDNNSTQTSKPFPIKMLHFDDVKSGAAATIQKGQRCAPKAMQLRPCRAIDEDGASAQAVDVRASAHAIAYHPSAHAMAYPSSAQASTSEESVHSARWRREGSSAATEREAIQREIEREEAPHTSLLKEQNGLQKKTYEQGMGEEGQNIVDALWKDSLTYNISAKSNYSHSNTIRHALNIPHQKLRNASVQCHECNACKKHRQKRNMSAITDTAVQCPSVSELKRMRKTGMHKPRHTYKVTRSIGIGTDIRRETGDIARKTYFDIKREKTSRGHPNVPAMKGNVKLNSATINAYKHHRNSESEDHSTTDRGKFHSALKSKDHNRNLNKRQKHVKINDTPRIFQDEHYRELKTDNTYKTNPCKFRNEFKIEDTCRKYRCKHQKYAELDNTSQLSTNICQKPLEIDGCPKINELQRESKIEDSHREEQYKYRKQGNIQNTFNRHQQKHSNEFKREDFSERNQCKHERELKIKAQDRSNIKEIDEWTKYYQITDRGALYRKKKQTHISHHTKDDSIKVQKQEKNTDFDRVNPERRIRPNRSESKLQAKTHSALKAMRRIILPGRDIDNQGVIARECDDARRLAHIERILQPNHKDVLVTTYQAKIDSSTLQCQSTSPNPVVGDTAYAEDKSDDLSLGAEISEENIYFEDKFVPTKTSSPTENKESVKQKIVTEDVSPIPQHFNCGFFKMLHETLTSENHEETQKHKEDDLGEVTKFERSSTESQQGDEVDQPDYVRSANSSRTKRGKREPSPIIKKSSPQKLHRRLRNHFKDTNLYSYFKKLRRPAAPENFNKKNLTLF